MNYRQSDPVTSQQAFATINANGKAQAHRVIITHYVKEHPNQTAGEIGEGTELGQVPVSRRLSEIKAVVPTTIRRCSVCGTNQRTWVYLV